MTITDDANAMTDTDATPACASDTATTPPDAPTLGQRALVVAQAELAAGVREEPMGSNRGARVDEYAYPTGLRGQPWCAMLESWCRRKALRAGEANPLGYHASVAALWRAAVTAPAGLARPPQWAPRVGDLAVFKRAGQDPRIGGEGHVARIESPPDGYGAYVVIAGNSANAVARESHSIHDADLVGWVACD